MIDEDLSASDIEFLERVVRYKKREARKKDAAKKKARSKNKAERRARKKGR